MDVRKLQEMGGTTLLVSIPREWARRADLRKGSSVSIEESNDGGLLIYPARPEQERPEKEIEIANPSRFGIERLSGEITAAYLLGYDLIRIKGHNSISAQDRERIMTSLKRLIGLEIVEEDERSITSQFLVDNTVVEPSKLFRRISSLVRAMISDTLRNLIETEKTKSASIAQRDDEVDRLHFLLVRLIRTAVRDSRVASKFGLSSIDCLDFRVATSSLETAADYTVDLSNEVSLIESKELISRELIPKIAYLLEAIHDGATRSFLEKDFAAAQKVLQDHFALTNALKDLKSAYSSASILHLADTLERITRCELDVADLVSPTISH